MSRWQDFDYKKWIEEDGKFDHETYEKLTSGLIDRIFNKQEDAAIISEYPTERPPWKPNAFYNAEGDILEIWLSDTESYDKWLNPQVTLMLSEKNDEIVGVQIEGLMNTICRDRTERTEGLLKKIMQPSEATSDASDV